MSSVPPYDEPGLLANCMAGDVSSFEPIVEAYRGRAYAYAFSMMGNHHDALDLSQEAFARAFRSLHRFDAARPFQPWFLRILRNLCLNSLRRKRRRPETPGPDDGQAVLALTPSPWAGPDVEAARVERAEQVRQALEKLSRDHREVVQLRHFQDMSYVEIAGVLEIPVGTVMSRLFHARRGLAELLRNEGRSE